MNQISTQTLTWHQKCENWAEARQAFRVLDVNRVSIDTFFMFICMRHKFALNKEGDTVVFKPIESLAIAIA